MFILVVGFDTMDKIFLFYDQPFWPKHKGEIGIIRDHNELASKVHKQYYIGTYSA